jgi:endonuclease/exonuclease/phosphatase family metal-dependent hydrolase
VRRLTVVSANTCYGGINPDTGDDSGARVTIEALRGADPDVALLQEMDARGDPYRLWRHLRHFASALDMEPVLGPSAAIRSELGNHTAILVSARRGLRVADQWPPPAPAGPRVPWCRAEVTVPGLARPVHFCSVHLSARSAADQLRAAQVIASYVRAQHHPAVVGGDFNGYAPGEPAAAEPAALPAHLRGQPRWRRGPGGVPEPDYAVHDTLADAGLTDIAAHLPPGRRDRPGLTGTARAGRIDRIYLTGAATEYRQQDTGGSDHHMLLLTLDLTAAAAAVPPGPVH